MQKVRHVPSGHVLALKTITAFAGHKPDEALKEIATLCTNAVTFYNAFFHNCCFYLAIEYMACGSLHDIVQRLEPTFRQQAADGGGEDDEQGDGQPQGESNGAAGLRIAQQSAEGG